MTDEEKTFQFQNGLIKMERAGKKPKLPKTQFQFQNGLIKILLYLDDANIMLSFNSKMV